MTKPVPDAAPRPLAIAVLLLAVEHVGAVGELHPEAAAVAAVAPLDASMLTTAGFRRSAMSAKDVRAGRGRRGVGADRAGASRGVAEIARAGVMLPVRTMPTSKPTVAARHDRDDQETPRH